MTDKRRNNSIDNPIEIAGAGPSGLAAAITLARAGRRVIVHEAHKEVGHRFGGDFQGLENWTTREDVLKVLQDLGLTTDFTTMPGRSGSAFDASGKCYEINSDEPLFYLVERGPGPDTLDSALLRQAQSLGVEVRFNSCLRQMAGDGILAAGPRAADAIAVGYHFETDRADGYWVICNDDLAPKGYAYLLIMNGKGTVKSCMFSGFKQEKLYVQRTLDAFQRLVGLEMKNPRPHGGSGNFRIPQSAYSGPHPLVGEQAGFQDTLWGFGMRLAISSGVLAARSLLTGDNYDTLWQRELKPLMKTSVVNRVLFSLLGNRGYGWFLRRYIASPNLRESLRRQYQPSWPKRLLDPWARYRYESQRKDAACDHVDCHCIWCRGECCIHE
ncbi:MAG TPA: NAD(P)/FAD-dependent oxidoreductase [Gammaproteobacteria bacterium]|nr:NAD(P)/FAD-dependent oxidoreductase [Gammaproteobacteria bacterium]